MKEQYSRIVIHVGTNDCAERDTTAEEMMDLCEKMVRSLKNETVEITISAVLPICHDDETTGRIASLNVGLQALAQDTASKFITHEDYTVASGNANDGYLLDDGTHMSRRGSERLIADLQIKYIAKQQRKTYTITQRVKQIHAQIAVKQTTIRGSAGSAIDS